MCGTFATQLCARTAPGRTRTPRTSRNRRTPRRCIKSSYFFKLARAAAYRARNATVNEEFGSVGRHALCNGGRSACTPVSSDLGGTGHLHLGPTLQRLIRGV